jgi:hypothetical protein
VSGEEASVGVGRRFVAATGKRRNGDGGLTSLASGPAAHDGPAGREVEMGLINKVVEKVQDVAGGVGGTREETGREGESRQPNEAHFDPQEVRRQKEPGDDLPKPEGVSE